MYYDIREGRIVLFKKHKHWFCTPRKPIIVIGDAAVAARLAKGQVTTLPVCQVRGRGYSKPKMMRMRVVAVDNQYYHAAIARLTKYQPKPKE